MRGNSAGRATGALLAAALLAASGLVLLTAVPGATRALSGAPLGPAPYAWTNVTGATSKKMTSNVWSTSYEHDVFEIWSPGGCPPTQPSGSSPVNSVALAGGTVCEYQFKPTGAFIDEKSVWSGYSSATDIAMAVIGVWDSNESIAINTESNSSIAPSCYATAVPAAPTYGQQFFVLISTTAAETSLQVQGGSLLSLAYNASAAAPYTVAVIQGPVGIYSNVEITAGASANWICTAWTLTNNTYDTPFAETGLTGSLSWSVTTASTYGGSSTASGTSTLKPHSPNGTTTFIVTPPSGWVANPTTGTIAVSGGPAGTTTIVFDAVQTQVYYDNTTKNYWDNTTKNYWTNTTQVHWDNTTKNYWTNTTVNHWDNTTQNHWTNTTVNHWDNTTNNYWTNTTKLYYDNTTKNYWDNTTENYWDNTTKNYWTNTTVNHWDNTTKNYWTNTTKNYWDNTTKIYWDNTTKVYWDNTTQTHWDNTTKNYWDNTTEPRWTNTTKYDNTTEPFWENTTTTVYHNSTSTVSTSFLPFVALGVVLLVVVIVMGVLVARRARPKGARVRELPEDGRRRR